MEISRVAWDQRLVRQLVVNEPTGVIDEDMKRKVGLPEAFHEAADALGALQVERHNLHGRTRYPAADVSACSIALRSKCDRRAGKTLCYKLQFRPQET